MSDPTDIATGAAGGAAGSGLLWWLVTRVLKQGDAAEHLLAERGEKALEDHKQRLAKLERAVAQLEEWAASKGRPR